MNKNDDAEKPRPAVGGLVGRATGGRIEDSHAKVEIRVNGKPADVDVGGLVGQSENTEIVNSSAEAKLEFADETHPGERILELKPNVYGFGVNLRPLWRKARPFFRKDSSP